MARPHTMPSSTDGRLFAQSPRDMTFVNDPYVAYQAMHAAGGVIFWEEYGHWCFTGFDRVNGLLRDRRFGRQILHLATREELGMAQPRPHLADFDRVEAHSLLELEPPTHTRMRALVNRAFVSRAIERMRPEVEALCHALVDGFESRREVELLRAYAEIVPATIIARMLGIPDDRIDDLLAWSHSMVRMYMFGRDERIEQAANQAAREFSDYLLTLIAQRRSEPRDDLISHMIASEKDGARLSDDELVSTAILLLNAGHEATVHQLGNAVKAILESGSDPVRLFRTDAAAAATVEECLRYDAPLHMFSRYALADIELEDGIVLRKGETIGLMLGAANRDPTRFEQPGRFDPTRENVGHVSFGAGIHFCIGAPLARLELQIGLAVLFDQLSRMRLASAPRYRDAYHFHGLERLDLVW
jgi:cytochrome P450